MMNREMILPSMSREEYQQKLLYYQTELNMLQRYLRDNHIPLIIVIEGLEASGKGKIIEELTRPLDPRAFRVFPVFLATKEERMYPFLYRFWQWTPAKGRLHVFNRSWYIRLLDARVKKSISRSDWYVALKEVREFERTLIDNGTHILKFWLNMSKKEQKRRLEKRETKPDLQFRVNKDVWKDHKRYEKYSEMLQQTLMHTDTTRAPWQIIPADNPESARIMLLQSVTDRMVDLVGKEFREVAESARAELSRRGA
ncbi:MAG: hypothetical protein KDK41_08545 [Leptospiraceae bacterium]|nr:hypothetical protein [Leptospiraceae bacterium]